MVKKQEITLSWLALPLEELLSMSDAAFAAVAEESNTSASELRKMLRKAQKDCESRKAKFLKQESARRELFRIPGHVRGYIQNIAAGFWLLKKAEILEYRGFAHLENDISSSDEAEACFFEAQKIIIGNRLFELCQEYFLESAIHRLKNEVDEMRRLKGNTYVFGKATQRALSEIFRGMRQLTYKPEAGRQWDVSGSAEKFSAVVPHNYPKAPRPRRYNDENEHY